MVPPLGSARAPPPRTLVGPCRAGPCRAGVASSLLRTSRQRAARSGATSQHRTERNGAERSGARRSARLPPLALAAPAPPPPPHWSEGTRRQPLPAGGGGGGGGGGRAAVLRNSWSAARVGRSAAEPRLSRPPSPLPPSRRTSRGRGTAPLRPGVGRGCGVERPLRTAAPQREGETERCSNPSPRRAEGKGRWGRPLSGSRSLTGKAVLRPRRDAAAAQQPTCSAEQHCQSTSLHLHRDVCRLLGLRSARTRCQSVAQSSTEDCARFRMGFYKAQASTCRHPFRNSLLAAMCPPLHIPLLPTLYIQPVLPHASRSLEAPEHLCLLGLYPL